MTANKRMVGSGPRQPNDRLRAKRLERGQTQEEVAEDLSRLRWQEDKGAPAFTGSMVSKWERGQRPRPQQRRLLVEHFGTSAEDLGLRLPPPVGATGPNSASAGYPGRTKRRTFLVGGVGTVAGLAGAASTPASADPLLTAMNRLHRLAGVSIGGAIDGYEAVVVDLGLSYSREPVVRVYTRADALLANAQEIIDANPPDAYRRRLLSLAGWSAGLLANALHDLSDSAAATANAALALEYGRQAGDTRLMAYVYDKQAMFAADARHLAVALRLVQEGRQLAPERTAISVRLRAAEAHLHARLGEGAEAMNALRLFETEFGRLPDGEFGEGTFDMSRTFLDRGVGRTLMRLGRPEAETHLRRSITHYEGAVGQDRRPTRLATDRLWLALALAGQGRPDEAAAVAGMALGTDRLTSGLMREAGQVEAALTEQWPELSQARDYRERYFALAAEAGPPE